MYIAMGVFLFSSAIAYYYCKKINKNLNNFFQFLQSTNTHFKEYRYWMYKAEKKPGICIFWYVNTAIALGLFIYAILIV